MNKLNEIDEEQLKKETRRNNIIEMICNAATSFGHFPIMNNNETQQTQQQMCCKEWAG